MPNGVSAWLNLTSTKGMQVTASSSLSGDVDAGEALNIAIDFIPGAAQGTESDALRDAAKQVYGASKSAAYDGTNYAQTSLPQSEPDGFNGDKWFLDPDAFASWNSAYQAEFIKKFPSGVDDPAVQIGHVEGGGRVIRAVLAESGDRVIILENLQKADFAKLNAGDQFQISKTWYFNEVLASQLGLTKNSSGAFAAIDSVLSTIQSVTTVASSGSNGMTADEKQPFIDELNLIKSQLGKMTVFSLQDISNQVDAIAKRFDRASKFAVAQQEQTISYDVGFGVSIKTGKFFSTDGAATIRNGYQNLIAQEKQIRNVSMAVDALVRNAGTSERQFDAPMLIFYFQLDTSLRQEAVITADTEEVKQLNALLNLYSQMQGLVHQTIATFTSTDAKEQKTLLNQSSYFNLATAEPSPRVIMSVFEDNLGTARHPLEGLYGIKRPTLDMMNNSTLALTAQTKESWNGFNSALSETVSQLNQQTQLLMDRINSQTKEKDRHFDLGNNALGKMADMIQSIGRGIS